MQSNDLVQIVVSGLAMGSVYTLMGMGLFITFLTSRALNFGQGDFLMVATFVSMALALAGMPAIVGILVTLAGLAGLGAILERVAVRPLGQGGASGADGLGWVLTTMGVGMILQNIVTLVWGKSKFYSPPLFGKGDKQIVEILGAGVFVEEILVAGTCLVVVAVLLWILFRTRWGNAISAVAFDRDTASLLAIDVRKTVMLSYVIMAVLAAICGILVGPIVSAQAHMGLLYVLKGFAVVCIGGFANPLGILIAGLGFGLAEAFSNYFDSSLGDLYPFLLVLVFLVARPSGLFGESRADLR